MLDTVAVSELCFGRANIQTILHGVVTAVESAAAGGDNTKSAKSKGRTPLVEQIHYRPGHKKVLLKITQIKCALCGRAPSLLHELHLGVDGPRLLPGLKTG